MDLVFHSVRETMFVFDFESQHDQDRVGDGSSSHVSKHAMILEEFVACMRPLKLQLDKLQL